MHPNQFKNGKLKFSSLYVVKFFKVKTFFLNYAISDQNIATYHSVLLLKCVSLMVFLEFKYMTLLLLLKLLGVGMHFVSFSK